MRCALNRVVLLAVGTALFSRSLRAGPRAEEKPPPVIVEERPFNRPKTDVADILANPFYIPERFAKMVLYPMGRLTGWALERDVPERVVDFLTDETGRILFLPYLDYSTSDGLSLGGIFRYSNMFYQKKKLGASGSLAMNLDSRASLSFSKSASYDEPIFYRVGFKYKLDKDADFYGLGINSSRHDKSIYSHSQVGFSLRLGWRWRKLRFLSLAGSYGILHHRTETGSGPGSTRRVEETFPLENLTGFGAHITWFMFGATLKYDSRIPAGHPYRGGVISLSGIRFMDVDGHYSHYVFSARAIKVIDLYRQLNVLAIGVGFQSVEDFGEGEIPFFRLPTASGLRGFSKRRFADRRVLIGSVDYRFRLWTSIKPNPAFVIGTLFVDFGKPFGDLDSLARDGIKFSVGTGLIYTTRSELMASGRLAYGGEGIETRISIGSLF